MFDYIYDYYKDHVLNRKVKPKEWIIMAVLIAATGAYLYFAVIQRPFLMAASFVIIMVIMRICKSNEKKEKAHDAKETKEIYDKKTEPLIKLLQNMGMYNIESIQWLDGECEKRLTKENRRTPGASFANAIIWPTVLAFFAAFADKVDVVDLVVIGAFLIISMVIIWIFIVFLDIDIDTLNQKKIVLERFQTDIAYIRSQYVDCGNITEPEENLCSEE